MAKICCAVGDMIFATKIRGTAEALDAEVAMTQSSEQLLSEISDDTRLVIIDLNLENEDVLELIRRVRRLPNPPRIISYLPHVQTDLAAAAREAGADEVLPRSRFSAEIATILSGHGG